MTTTIANAAEKKAPIQNADSRYLLYRIGTELYGTPLLRVREVVEYMTPKIMPNMASHFMGVINIRGSIVGVVDLRIKLGLPAETAKGKQALLVCETPSGALGALVDRIDSVILIPESQIDTQPPIATKFANTSLIGVAKLPTGLITLINLDLALTDDQLAKAVA